MLDQTAKSLDELEDHLKKRDFNLSGRIVICGYEEQAVPTYNTNYKKPKISDEASVKGISGWSMRLHNKFGFMTGFLFKDVDYFNNRWFKDGESIFEHIHAEQIEVFDDKAVIFQRHAFGDGVGLVYDSQIDILRSIKKQDCKEAFKFLISFWRNLYEHEIKSDGKQVVGTQDIFFSIEYARHLVRSSVPFLKYYTGPDITYPIEVSLKQEKAATAHSQEFSTRFVNYLKPINDKPTAYVFCSFVDGVGKSTLLGNIQNRLKYGDSIEKFERVDNSSSQLAAIFKVDENLFIADLPAQVSHFTYKPDGFVYAPVEREMKQEEINKVVKFVGGNKSKFLSKYLSDISKPISSSEPDGFIKNLKLLKKIKTNKWIPFQFKQNSYLFNRDHSDQIRVLKPLGFVQSEGLKNIESEQMLFSKGVRLPMPYKFFLDDLTSKLKDVGVENVVMVDFTSMYPRSSRENIRINYLLQQLATVDSNFNPVDSLYRDFQGDSEFLYCLKQDDFKEKAIKAFYNETITRLAIYELITDKKDSNINGLSMATLTKVIKDYMRNLSVSDKNFLHNLVIAKVDHAEYRLEMSYGLSKPFVNLYMFSFEKLYRFSNLVMSFFNKPELLDRYGKEYGFWKDVVDRQDNKVVSKIIDIDNKDSKILAPFLRLLRASWYATFSNLLLDKEDPKFIVPPIWLERTVDNKFLLKQRSFRSWEEELPKSVENIKRKFNLTLSKKGKWGIWKNDPVRLDWLSLSTNKGIYAFDCDMNSTKMFFSNKSIITFLVNKYQKKHGVDVVMPTSKLYKKLMSSLLWKNKWKRTMRDAKKNGYKGDKKKSENIKKESKSKFFLSKKKALLYLGRQNQKVVARLFVRFIATFEMLVKDPNSDVVVRLGNKKDFRAALLLLEKVTLPKFFGLVFEKGLFDDYDDVKPIMELF